MKLVFGLLDNPANHGVDFRLCLALPQLIHDSLGLTVGKEGGRTGEAAVKDYTEGRLMEAGTGAFDGNALALGFVHSDEFHDDLTAAPLLVFTARELEGMGREEADGGVDSVNSALTPAAGMKDFFSSRLPILSNDFDGVLCAGEADGEGVTVGHGGKC